MTRISAQAVVDSLAASMSPSASPRLLHDVVAETLLSAGNASDLDEAMEQAEALLPKVRVLVSEMQFMAEQQGVTWRIELYGSGDEYLRGSSSADGTLSPEEQRARSCRAHTDTILAELIALTAGEFEVACTAILRLMGCLDPRTSPIGNDGGLDFYGHLELKGRLDNGSPYGGFDGRLGLWLVGQAKHYPTRPVQTASVRELVGSVELARTGGAIHTWEGLRLRPFDAVIQLIFTTGTFSSGAQKLLDRSGVLSMSGRQLATFLADAGVGIDSVDWTFDRAIFRSALGL